MDKSGQYSISNMSSTGPLTELEERILLTLWKLKGVGKDRVKEDTLRTDPTLEATNALLKDEIEKLLTQGFLETASVDDHSAISLTPLGLAILRQIEEDKLQELK